MEALLIENQAFYNCDITYPVIINAKFAIVGWQAFSCNFNLYEVAFLVKRLVVTEDILGACNCKYIFMLRDTEIQCLAVKNRGAKRPLTCAASAVAEAMAGQAASQARLPHGGIYLSRQKEWDAKHSFAVLLLFPARGSCTYNFHLSYKS